MSLTDRHSQRSPSRSRLLALPLVTLCAVVYLSGAAHFALVQHATCGEHGEIIHAEEGGVHAAPQRLEAPSNDRRLAQASQEATAAHGAEAHCAHSLLRREGLMSPATVLLAAAPEVDSGPVFGREQLHSEPVARLRLAPKASPPLS